eukprot:CAMPEP_0194342266 /NCGR_PEP_ID=MMETSP0171-20130528/92240_1 /TAXON_ID=218684 /ORGANISM="Corethron pennatum, Strain L29A3" /LENGTH=252 /DNA_ID=CAMNT_0039107911 /DNA_START=333 /DNA_END=1088 /DNA_ORIENTATION=+
MPGFVRSFFDGDAPEIDHQILLWNYVTKCIQNIDAVTDAAQITAKDGAVDQRVSSEKEKEVVADLRYLRHTLQVFVNRVTAEDSPHEWQTLLDDTDLCLHEFNHRFFKEIPKCPKKRIKNSNSPSNSSVKEPKTTSSSIIELTARVTSRTFFKTDASDSSFDLHHNKKIYYEIGGIWRVVRVSRAVRNMRAVRVSYEDFSSFYDEYLSLDSIVSADNDSNISWDDLIPETTVKCVWGSNFDLYYAKVKEKTS